jgi:sugar-specific transcriptional regulator TrmB
MKKQEVSNNIRNALLQLNISEKEIATYISLLENGSASILDISKSTGINRVTTYAAIEELKEKGLVAETRKGKRKLFVAEDPDGLLGLVNEKRERLASEEKMLAKIIPSLKALNISQPNKPQIKFFEGKEGITRIFDEYVLNTSEAINCGSYETAVKALTKDSEKKYFENIKSKKMFYRMILEDTALNREFAELARSACHVKFLPVGQKIAADIVIAGSSNTALISYDRLTATLVEDRSIAQAIKMYLDFMWEKL